MATWLKNACKKCFKSLVTEPCSSFSKLALSTVCSYDLWFRIYYNVVFWNKVFKIQSGSFFHALSPANTVACSLNQHYIQVWYYNLLSLSCHSTLVWCLFKCQATVVLKSNVIFHLNFDIMMRHLKLDIWTRP